jgi:hypothetical protein
MLAMRTSGSSFFLRSAHTNIAGANTTNPRPSLLIGSASDTVGIAQTVQGTVVQESRQKVELSGMLWLRYADLPDFFVSTALH